MSVEGGDQIVRQRRARLVITHHRIWRGRLFGIMDHSLGREPLELFGQELEIAAIALRNLDRVPGHLRKIAARSGKRGLEISASDLVSRAILRRK